MLGPMAELQILNGPRQWQTVQVAGPRFIIGRREGCHLVLKDGWISREHAVIVESRPGEFIVRDLESENGIFIGGARVTEAPLHTGDILRVGRTEMRFLAGVGPGAAESTAQEPGRRTVTPIAPVTTALPREEPHDQTLHSERPERGPRMDARDRGRRLESQLLRSEEDNARLAAENAVLKRALASAGLLDRRTGHVDVQRLRQGGGFETAGLAGLPPLNERTRAAAPREGGFLVVDAVEAPSDAAPGVLSPAIVGVGDPGARLARAFERAGRRTWVLPPGAAEQVREAGAFEAGLLAAVGPGRDGVLLLASAAGEEEWRELLLVTEAVYGTGGTATSGPCGVLLETRRARRWPGLGPGLEGQIRAGRWGSVLLIDQEWLDAPGLAQGDPELGPDTLAFVVDALLRLPMMRAHGDAPDRGSVRSLLFGAGLGTLGFSATAEGRPGKLSETVAAALGGGIASVAALPSRARQAWLLAVAGSRLGMDWEAASESLAAGLAAARSRVPQAQWKSGIYRDGGSSLRVVAALGGMTVPESLGT
jgi:hypothetical protein